jgi:hypothetical protein
VSRLYLEVSMKQALLFRSSFVAFDSQVTIKGRLIIKKGIVITGAPSIMSLQVAPRYPWGLPMGAT